MSKADEGRVVRVTAVYETDRRHGALLSDANCPDASIRIGFDADEVDMTVNDFDKSLYATPPGPGMVKAAVDITGKIEASLDGQSARIEFRRIRINSFKHLLR